MKHIVLIIGIAALLVIGIQTVEAQGLLQSGGSAAQTIGNKGFKTLSECIQDGSCGAEHILILANNIIRWLLAISGALALFMYVAGGLWMLMSAGSSSRIERGKDILIGTTLALVFMLTSWLIINLVLKGIGAKPEYQITATACNAEGECAFPKVCHNKRCVDRCYIEKTLKETDANKQWSCRPPDLCGASGAPFRPLRSVDDCNGAPNCAPNLCADDQTVCCY